MNLISRGSTRGFNVSRFCAKKQSNQSVKSQQQEEQNDEKENVFKARFIEGNEYTIVVIKIVGDRTNTDNYQSNN